MLAAVLSKALRRVSRRKGSWPEKSFFCLKQAEIQVGCHKLLEPSSYCRSPGLKSRPKSRSAPQAWGLFSSAALLTSLTVVASEAWWAPAGEPAGTVEAGGSVLTGVGEALIHI